MEQHVFKAFGMNHTLIYWACFEKTDSKNEAFS
jgi:hypothetical protein